MHPREWWLYFEAKIPPDKLKSPAEKWGSLYEMLERELNDGREGS